MQTQALAQRVSTTKSNRHTVLAPEKMACQYVSLQLALDLRPIPVAGCQSNTIFPQEITQYEGIRGNHPKDSLLT